MIKCIRFENYIRYKNTRIEDPRISNTRIRLINLEMKIMQLCSIQNQCEVVK